MARKLKPIEAPVNVVAPGAGAAEAAPVEAPVATLHIEVPAALTTAKAVAESAVAVPAGSKRRRRRRPWGGIVADPHWAMRRRTIGLTLLSCLGISVYGISQGADMAAVVLPSMASLAAACVGVYTFGASWERIGGVPDGNLSYDTDIDIDVDVRRGE